MLMRRMGLLVATLVLALVSGAATAAPPKDAIVVGLLAEPVTMDPA